MNPPLVRWVRGMIGGAVGVLLGFSIAFPLLLVVGPSTIFNEAIQSPKVLSAWGDPPLPLYVTNLGLALAGIALVGAAWGLVFVAIVKGLPTPTAKRGLAFGLILFAAFLFAEVAFPFALLLEPVPLVALELAIFFPGALIAGLIISAIYGRPQTAASG